MASVPVTFTSWGKGICFLRHRPPPDSVRGVSRSARKAGLKSEPFFQRRPDQPRAVGPDGRPGGRDGRVQVHLAAPRADAALSEPLQGLGIDAVFHGMDAPHQAVRIFPGVDRHGGLDDHRAAVHLFLHEMHGAAGNFDPVSLGVGPAVHAGKAGQQRRVDVDDPPGKSLQKGGTEQAHVSGQDDEFRAAFPQHGDELPVVALPVRKEGVVQSRMGQPGLAGALQHARARPVAEDHADVHIQNAGGGLIDHGLGVGAAARGQYGDFQGHSVLNGRLRPA